MLLTRIGRSLAPTDPVLDPPLYTYIFISCKTVALVLAFSLSVWLLSMLYAACVWCKNRLLCLPYKIAHSLKVSDLGPLSLLHTFK